MKKIEIIKVFNFTNNGDEKMILLNEISDIEKFINKLEDEEMFILQQENEGILVTGNAILSKIKNNELIVGAIEKIKKGPGRPKGSKSKKKTKKKTKSAKVSRIAVKKDLENGRKWKKIKTY